MQIDGRLRRHGCRWSVLGMGLLWAAGVAAAGDSPFSFGADAFYVSDDNVSKSQFDADRREDASFTATANASYTKDLSFLSALTFTGALSNEEFKDFDGLSNTQISLTSDFRFQTRSGFTAPIYSVFVRVIEADFETDIRDGTTVEFGASATRRITDRISGTLGLTASRRRADGEVFDLERVRYFGNLDWRLSNTIAVYGTYSYIDGDVFSTATPTLPIINWADAIEPDNAFGGEANNKFVYRLDADTTIFRLGVNIGLGRNMSIDISADDLESEAGGPIGYELTAVSAGVLYRF